MDFGVQKAYKKKAYYVMEKIAQLGTKLKEDQNMQNEGKITQLGRQTAARLR